MNLEKLGFLLFLKATENQSAIRSHFEGAVRQIVLAALKSIRVVQSATLESDVLQSIDGLEKVWMELDALNQKWLNKLDDHTQSSSQTASKKFFLRQILNEILAGLDQEKQDLSQGADSETMLKIQALDAISIALKRRFSDENQVDKTQDSASKNEASRLVKQGSSG